MKKDDVLMVTIRCVAYNHECYIRQCLEGFVTQKTNFRFEAIVHDDASTDKTASIIREYAQKYPEIIKPIFEKENQYSKKDGSLRKIMDSHTHGKYVALCEGDDYWTDSLKLQKQVDFLEAHPDYSMCFHNAVIMYLGIKKAPVLFNNLECSRQIHLNEIVDHWIIPTASILYRKDILPMPTWATKIYSGDQTLALMAYAKGKIWGFEDVMSVYRQNFVGSSATARANKMGETYVVDQHLLLYNYYNEETNYKYSNIISNRINYLKKQRLYLSNRYKHGKIYSFLMQPIFVSKKIVNRINKIKM